jgi:hypothetical protein
MAIPEIQKAYYLLLKPGSAKDPIQEELTTS